MDELPGDDDFLSCMLLEYVPLALLTIAAARWSSSLAL